MGNSSHPSVSQYSSHRYLQYLVLCISYCYQIWDQPLLINPAEARTAGKGTSLTIQSLTCSSQETGAHWFPQTQQFILLVNLYRNPWSWVWTERKLSWQDSRRWQNKLLCLLYWPISSHTISTHRWDLLNLRLCNQPCYCIAPSVTGWKRSKVTLVLCRTTCCEELPVHSLNKVHKKHTKVVYPIKLQFGPCS